MSDPTLNTQTERLANLIHATAASLFDVSATILSTRYATAEDWELARAAASHLLLALQEPPAPTRYPHPGLDPYPRRV